MNEHHPIGDSQVELPSFSVVLEAFTVTAETAEGLADCLASIAGQDLAPDEAREFLLLSVGQIEREELNRICAPYPWVQLIELAPGTRYFGIKMAGARRATGDVVVFCDADNVYLDGWLRSMVAPFQDPDLNVLTGQTSVRCEDLASTAFGLTFFFPPFKPDTGLEMADTYFGNNSAFRREFLMAHPIDTSLPLLRGHDYVHSFWLRQAGQPLWRQTGSRAYHAAPDSAKEFVLRYLARGSDRLEIWRRTIGRLASERQGPGKRGALGRILGVLWENVSDFASRLAGVARQSPRALIYYPLAVPIGLCLMGLVIAGLAVSYFRPGALVEKYLDEFHGHEEQLLATEATMPGDRHARG